MATNWNRIIKLNGGEPIYYVAPKLDVKNEVWFYLPASELAISRNGILTKTKTTNELDAVTERTTLYMVAKALFVDVEVRNAHAVVRRGVLNGAYVECTLAANEVPALLDAYRAIDFRDGSPWHATPKRVLVREFRQADKKWTIHIDGSSVFENWRTEHKQESRDAAIAFAKALIARKEELGFRTRLIELTESKYANPVPKAAKVPKGARALAKAAKPPSQPTFAKPSTPYEAVDTAVAMLRDLHQRYNKFHFIAECLDVSSEQARLGDLTQSAKFFSTLHRRRIGRWRTTKAHTPKKNESSWDYFVRVYGSITWIVDGEVDHGIQCFHCGNVSGGGWSPLEIAADLYDIKGLVHALGKNAPVGLDQLLVFHGGWHHDLSFAFDRRSSTKSGELAIILFDDNIYQVPKITPTAKILPFGTWLLKTVKRLSKIVESNIREIW